MELNENTPVDTPVEIPVDAPVGNPIPVPEAYGSDAPPSSDTTSTGEPQSSVDRPAVRKIEYRQPEPVDLVEPKRASVVKRAAAPFVALVFLAWWLTRRVSKAPKS